MMEIIDLAVYAVVSRKSAFRHRMNCRARAGAPAFCGFGANLIGRGENDHMMREKELPILDYGKEKDRRKALSVEREKRFTRIYQAAAGEHAYLREMKCLQAQTEMIFLPLRPGDLFAGEIDRMFVGIDPERGDIVETAYYCQHTMLKEHLADGSLDSALRRDIEDLLSFWAIEDTHAKCRASFSADIAQALPSDAYYENDELSYPMYGFGGPCLDYDKLMQVGIGGLRDQLTKRLATADNEDAIAFLRACLGALEAFCAVAIRYAQQAAALFASDACDCPEDGLRLRDDLYHICEFPPQTYAQAIQLFWLYSLMSLTRNYGRMDVYLGDFLAADLEKGRIDEKEADRLTLALWKMIARRTDNFNNRVIIGGKGRRNAPNADVFAEYAIRAQVASGETIPQLSLRCYESMNELLWRQAFHALANGCTFPILHNDDVNIPACRQALRVDEAAAEQYMMYGCGEMLIDHQGIAAPDGALNLAKLLDVTLNNGVETYSGRRMGLALGSLLEYSSFEALLEAYFAQVRHQMDILSRVQASIYDCVARYAAYPFLSMLYDDCIARAKPILTGGARYRGGIVECFGNTTMTDALVAIRTLVYEEKSVKPERLLAGLRDNFVHDPDLRAKLIKAPKFGNDDERADALNVEVTRQICRIAQEAVCEGLYKGSGARAVDRREQPKNSRKPAPSARGEKGGYTALPHHSRGQRYDGAF